MVAVNRGSTSRIAAIKEATAGTTPATPVLLELPIVSFTPSVSNTVIRSDQIRSHPFPDKILKGRLVYDFGLDFELAGAVHDILLETMLGGTITSKALKATDALKSLTIEERVATGDFNQFTYATISSMGIQVGAGDTTPIRVTCSGSMIAGTLDANATIATSVTSAADVDPYIFAGATISIAGNATDVTSGSLNMERAVDPLMVLGSRQPREFVPGAFTTTGSITVPYDDTGNSSGDTVSAFVTGFADAALVFRFANEANTAFRTITMPKVRFTSLGRPLQDRGMRMQELNYEAYYDTSSATILTLTTE